MTYSLPDYATGDTNYISKLNETNDTVEGALNLFEAQVLASSGAAISVGEAFRSLFGSVTAIIGAASYSPSTVTTTLTLSDGYAWVISSATVVHLVSPSSINFSGLGAATYYVDVDSTGAISRTSSEGADTLYSVVWNGSAFGDITRVAALLWGATEIVASQTSTALGASYDTLDARLEAGEAISVANQLPVADSTALVKGSSDATKRVRFEVDGVTTGTTRVLTIQDQNGTVALLSDIVDFVASGTGHASGIVPDPGATAGVSKFLCEDATFKVPLSNVTGVITGMEVTATPGGTTFDIASGVARFVNDYTTPGTITASNVTITAKTGVTDTYLTSPATYIAVDSANNVIQQTVKFTLDQLRDYVILAVIAHNEADDTILASSNLQLPTYSWDSVLLDLIYTLGGSVVDSCIYSGNAALTFARSLCNYFRLGAEYTTDKKTPSIKTLSAQSPAQFSVYARDGAGGFTNSAILTTLTPGKYDDNSGSTAGIPSTTLATNKWQGFRVWLSPNGYTLLQYGSVQYNSLAEAIIGVPLEAHAAPSVTSLTSFRGYLYMRGGATVTNNTIDAAFANTGRLGEGIGGGAGSGGFGTGDVIGPASATDLHIAVFDGTTGKLIKDGGTTLALMRVPRVQTVTYSASVTLDCSLYDVFLITLTGPITIDFSGGSSGQKVEVVTTQDATGSRVITWGTSVAFGSDITTTVFTASTGANKVDRWGLEYNSAATKMHAIAAARGY